MESQLSRYFKNLKSVNIETISSCNLSTVHPKCPIKEREKCFGKNILDIKAIENIFETLNNYGYTGLTGLHHYSEPLIDKRIVDIVKTGKRLCPHGKIQIWSNGILLTKEVGEKLIEAGVDKISGSVLTMRVIIIDLIKYLLI